MPSTTVRIKNLALAHIGHSIFLDDNNDEGNEPDVLNVLFDDALAVVLEDFWWSFARRFETLGLVTDFTTLTTPQKWNYAYRYPVNVVTIRGIITGPGELERNPSSWEIGSDATGRLIYTNQEEAIVEVTALITDATLYTAHFAMALSWYLAFLIVPALAKDKGIAGSMMVAYDKALMTAEAKDANEAHYDPQLQESEAMRARE